MHYSRTMNRGDQWNSGINNKPLACILISELVAKYSTDTNTDTISALSLKYGKFSCSKYTAVDEIQDGYDEH